MSHHAWREHAANARDLKVLIVDDDAGTRQTFEQILRLEGIQALSAETAEEGIEIARRADFDVILTDLRLTNMSGTELISVLNKTSSARLVLMSAFLTTKTAVEAIKLGAFDVIEKPVGADDLLNLVGACMHDREQWPRAIDTTRALQGRLILAPRSVVERWAGYVMKVCQVAAGESQGDFKTIREWARCIGVSYSTICETCRLLGAGPLDARDFARVLNALRGSIAHHCPPEVLLDVSSRRVLRALSRKAGIALEIRASRESIRTFLDTQRFIPEESEAVRLIRKLTDAWFS